MNPQTELFYPLTAPIVRPLTIYFWAKKMKIISGITINVAVAVISPHITPLAEIKPVARIGNVKAVLDVSTSAMINSFQAKIKANIAVEAIAGAERGKTMRNKTSKRLQPSINALSSISTGISKKNERSIQITNARLKAT